MFESITHGIRVTVVPEFQPAQSDPARDQFVWFYTVTIQNLTAPRVILLSRRWEITDAQGRTQVVEGPGVVGEHPRLAAGEQFTYTSGAPLPTATGFMTGLYRMRTEAGEVLDVAIPLFSLDSPFHRRSVQ